MVVDVEEEDQEKGKANCIQEEEEEEEEGRGGGEECENNKIVLVEYNRIMSGSHRFQCFQNAP